MIEKELLDLLNSDVWPEAAPSFLICSDTDEDKFERAEGILDYVGEELKDKKFLDFGCGEGHVAKKAIEMGSKAFGYDIVQTGSLDWNSGLTTDWETIKVNGPYDFILLYDVLDHCIDPVLALNQVKEVCGVDTKVFVRCHPFTSRHGGHLYKQMNKAFIHFIFNEEELNELGLKADIVQKTYFPIKDNNKWFSGVGFNVISQDTISGTVEQFFKDTQIILNKLPLNFYKNNFPDWQMSQLFNDYILKL